MPVSKAYILHNSRNDKIKETENCLYGCPGLGSREWILVVMENLNPGCVNVNILFVILHYGLQDITIE